MLHTTAARVVPLATRSLATQAAATSKGTIGDFFASLNADQSGGADPRLAQLKAAVAPPADVLARAWDSVNDALDAAVTRTGGDAENAVPIVDFHADVATDADGFASFSPAVADAIRSSGVAVVRGVIPEDVALGYKARAREYIADNAGSIVGFPEDDPQVFEIYYAKPQVEARQHANMLAVTTALNRLWHTTPAAAHTFSPLPTTYIDRMRIRQPGDARFTLGEHVDGGSLERWQDDTYRACYADILAGDWTAYDPFDATHRVGANMDLYDAANACSAQRTFQGWLSLSDCSPGEGMLRVVPYLKEATAYFMLRPFLDDVEDATLCGAVAGQGQAIDRRWHGPLVDACLTVPAVRPGDCVFWHCDVIHSVESKHGGATDSSVFYIPAVPHTPRNVEFARRQADHFQRGLTPPDFPQNHAEVEYVGRATMDDVTEAGRAALCPWER